MISGLSRSLLAATAVAAMTLMSASEAEAQRRGPRARVSTVVWVGGGWYAPQFVFYDPYWRGRWGPYQPYGYYGYPRYDRRSALRVDASPRHAQVLVDGYDAGTVDEFDGIFQRLYLEPGGHEITLYLAGYRTHTERLYLRPGDDHRLRVQLEPLAAGETAEPPPLPTPPRRAADAPERVDPPQPREREVRGRFGTLSLQVHPSSAEVYVDGERWNGVAEAGRLAIRLPEGRHRIEVKMPGYRTFVEDVLVRFGRTVTLNVSLAGG